jgi:hypothetical protein
MLRKRERITATFFLGLLLAAAVTQILHAQPSNFAPVSTETQKSQTVEKTEPTLLSVAQSYVTIVGGVIAGLGTVLGLPLVYQTFRKTRAEITKIELESTKLKEELRGHIASPGQIGPPDGLRIAMDGIGNTVTVLTDPKFLAPLLVLIDALIAGIFATIASYAIGTLPLGFIIEQPLRLIVYLVIFLPVLRSARNVKKSFGGGPRSSELANIIPPKQSSMR